MTKSKIKIISMITALLFLFNSLLFVVPDAASAAAPANSDISISLGRPGETPIVSPVNGVLGKNVTIPVTVKNTNTDPTAWIYNAGFVLVLDNGTEIGDTSSIPVKPYSVSFDGTTKKQTIEWKDVKDLAPGEEFTFDLPIKVLEKMKAANGTQTGADVAFGSSVNAKFTLKGSADPHLYDGLSNSLSFQIRPIPFEVKVNYPIAYPGKQLKGAGTTAASSDDVYPFDYTITINNNTRVPSTINLSYKMGNGIQVSDFSLNPALPISPAPTDGRTGLDWTGIGLITGEVKTITFKGAIFNKFTQAGTVNSGAVITDGTPMDSILDYSGYVNTVPGTLYTDSLTSRVIAKDLIIIKGVNQNTVGYNDALNYTLDVKINEYYGVDGVTVTDKLGDGQTYTTGSATSIPAPVIGSKASDGTTDIAWNLGNLGAKSSTHLALSSTIDTKWTSTGKSVNANDNIINHATAAGNDSYSGNISDSDYTEVLIGKPSLQLELIKINGAANSVMEPSVKVGDKLTYRLTYDASLLVADQKDVSIISFFPEGTAYYVDASYPTTFSSTAVSTLWNTQNTLSPTYQAIDPSKNYFRYDFDTIPKNSTMVVEYTLEVKDSAVITDQKQAFNLAKISFKNTAEDIYSERKELDLIYNAPVLTIDKAAAAGTDVNKLTPGQTVTFKVTVKNTGNADAYDMTVEDVLPNELVVSQPTVFDGGSYISGSPNKIQWTIPNLAAGASKDLTYSAQVISPIGAKLKLQNTAKVISYGKKTPGGVSYTDGPGKTLTMYAAGPTVAKTVYDQSRPTLSIGDWVVYKVTLTVPADIKMFNTKLEDTLPLGQTATVAGSVYSDYNVATHTGTLYSSQPGDVISAGPGQKLTINIGDLVGTGGVLKEYYIKTTVINSTPSQQQNKAEFQWDDKSSGGTLQKASSTASPGSVSVPSFTSSWSIPSQVMVVGDTRSNTYTITNNGQNTAYKFSPVLTMPSAYSMSNFTYTSAAGTNLPLVPINISDDGSINTVIFPEIDSLDKNSSYSINMDIALNAPQGASTTSTITGSTGVYYTTSYYTGVQAGHTADTTVTSPDITILKAVQDSENGHSVSEIRPGDIVTYNINVVLPQGTAAWQLNLEDTLPDDFEPVEFIDNTGVSKGAISSYTVGNYVYAENAPLFYNFQIKARAKISADYGTGNQKTETNTARISWNRTNGASPANKTSAASIDVVEPHLKIDSFTTAGGKAVFTSAGDSIAFNGAISNTGKSAANAVKVKATLPLGVVIDEAVISLGGTKTGANTIEWTFTSLDKAAVQNISFLLKEDGNPSTPSEGTVTLTIEEYYSTPDTVNSKKYQPDSKSLTVGTPSILTGLVFNDANGNGIRDLGELGIGNVKVDITDSASNVQQVTTASDGSYSAIVPAGQVNIIVHEPSNGAGYLLTTGNDHQTLTAAAGTKTAGDVGYKSIGMVSGLVFNDANGNGIKDAGEAGLSGVKVTIKEKSGTEHVLVTDANGRYSSPEIVGGEAVVTVEKPKGYELTTQGADNQNLSIPPDAKVEAEDCGFRINCFIELVAEPASILGNGKDTSKLTATVTDKNGNPVEGVQVVFDAGTKGSFAGGVNSAVTNAEGKAWVTYISADLSGTTDILEHMVTAKVEDAVKDLYAQDDINIHFYPGAVEGLVTDYKKDAASGSITNIPVNGAKVLVKGDINGDGILEEIGTVITGPDGNYKILVPKGNMTYTVEVTKPVVIGGKEEEATFEQKTPVGTVSGNGTDEVYSSNKTVTGVALLKTPDGNTSRLGTLEYGKCVIDIKDNAGKIIKDNVSVNGSGVFNAEVSEGTYTLELKYTIHNPVTNTDSQIIIGKLNVKIDAKGEMNISEVLIDPYGTVTDIDTGNVIEGADITLYYTDGTQVTLPAVSNFQPANNANPQSSDANGQYAYMVYPNKDYYIIATKPGYKTYTSPVISVGTEIVQHNIQMKRKTSSGSVVTTPTVPDVPKTSSEPVDLAVAVQSGTMKAIEGDIVEFTVTYRDKTIPDAEDAYITAVIPASMTFVDAGNNGVLEGNEIKWSLKTLKGQETGKLKFKLKVNSMDKAEDYAQVALKIGMADTARLINPEDDTSSIKLLLYSDRFEHMHKRYIKGYPDGEVKPERSITRAEVAAIFARTLDLKNEVQHVKMFKDVDTGYWGAEYIETVAKKGIFIGYEDNTFQPDKPITRAELATAIARYLGIAKEKKLDSIIKLSQFADTSNHWAEASIEEVFRFNIVSGYGDNSFKPDQQLTREETFKMINRMLYRGPLTAVEPSYPDNKKDKWSYGDVEETTRTHIFKLNKDGTETMVEYIPEPLW